MTRVFTDMEIWVEVRRRVLTGELSKRAACREYEIHWQTLEKILSHSEPPGYQKAKPRSSIVDAFVPMIEEILKSDRQVHRKQRHTARRIFERLRDEHGYSGGETIVKDAVRAWKQHHREVFLPLSHPPGEAAVFGRDLHSGISPGMYRSISGRSSKSVRVLRRRTDSHQL